MPYLRNPKALDRKLRKMRGRWEVLAKLYDLDLVYQNYLMSYFACYTGFVYISVQCVQKKHKTPINPFVVFAFPESVLNNIFTNGCRAEQTAFEKMKTRLGRSKGSYKSKGNDFQTQKDF